jgi:Skp family chaperone for outer membrane proteins
LASLLSVLLGAQAGMAQGTARAPAPQAAPAAQPSVVVIDIGYIFRHHNRFKQMMEDMKADLDAAEREFGGKRNEISQMAEGLKGFNVGSPDYNALEEKITEAQVRLQADMAKRKKEIVQKEAQSYFTVYREIEQEVQYFCERYGVNLVLRYNSEDIDPTNPQSVMQGVNRTVVYQSRVNITLDILARLQPPTTPTTRDPNYPPQPQGQRPTPSVSRYGAPVPH